MLWFSAMRAIKDSARQTGSAPANTIDRCSLILRLQRWKSLNFYDLVHSFQGCAEAIPESHLKQQTKQLNDAVHGRL